MARDSVGPDGATALLSVADVDLPLIERIRNGDMEAYGPLWKKYEHALYVFFFQRTKNRHEAEDLVSETLIAALNSIHRFRGEARSGSAGNCTFRTYLQTIARHQLSHWVRRNRTRNEVHVADFAASPNGEVNDEWAEIALSVATESTGNPLEDMLETERQEMVCFALASIDSPAQFKVVLLHYFAGLTHHDIATVLTTRSETVNTRLQDGRRAFRRQYERMDRSGPAP